jgi:hypothetical protein
MMSTVHTPPAESVHCAAVRARPAIESLGLPSTLVVHPSQFGLAPEVNAYDGSQLWL